MDDHKNVMDDRIMKKKRRKIEHLEIRIKITREINLDSLGWPWIDHGRAGCGLGG